MLFLWKFRLHEHKIKFTASLNRGLLKFVWACGSVGVNLSPELLHRQSLTQSIWWREHNRSRTTLVTFGSGTWWVWVEWVTSLNWIRKLRPARTLFSTAFWEFLVKKKEYTRPCRQKVTAHYCSHCSLVTPCTGFNKSNCRGGDNQIQASQRA